MAGSPSQAYREFRARLSISLHPMTAGALPKDVALDREARNKKLRRSKPRVHKVPYGDN
jgi:hypothetical protein